MESFGVSWSSKRARGRTYASWFLAASCSRLPHHSNWQTFVRSKRSRRLSTPGSRVNSCDELPHPISSFYILNVMLTHRFFSAFCRSLNALVLSFFLLTIYQRIRGVEILGPVTWYLNSHGNLFTFISSTHVLCATTAHLVTSAYETSPGLVTGRSTPCGVRAQPGKTSPFAHPHLMNPIES
jgi:hypothetical protein